MLTRIRHLLELVRFSHTIFALPFALLSSILAWRQTEFRWQHVAGILLCMVLARSAAMAFNRLVDRDIDAGNPRTARRHIPAGLLSVPAVTVFTMACSAGFVASTLVFLPNQWPVILSVPVLLFLLGYSYAKRWTALCHYWLSAALMMTPVAAWIAITGDVSAASLSTPALLAAIVFFWVGGFDIIYACQDTDFDQSRGLHSIPAKLGVRAALRVSFVSHVLTAVCLFLLWHDAELGGVFFAGAIAVSGLLAYEHWLVRPDDLDRVNLAFFNVNAIVSIGLLVVGAIDLWVSAM